jgi:hypothetical protein
MILPFVVVVVYDKQKIIKINKLGNNNKNDYFYTIYYNMKALKFIISTLHSLLAVFLMYLFFRYVFLLILLWIIIEIILKSVKLRKCNVIINFICNFVRVLLLSINYIMNILLSIPSNRMLLYNSDTPFGVIGQKFTQTLKINIVKGSIKPRGIILYKIFESIIKI